MGYTPLSLGLGCPEAVGPLDLASPYDEGIAFVMKRGEDGASAVWTGHHHLSTHSTAGPSRWTHLVGVTGRVRDETPPPRNAIGLRTPATISES